LFDGLSFAPVSLPYPNYSDALAPQPNTHVILIGQHGWPVALAKTYGSGKSLFMALGLEGWPVPLQPEVMNRSIGYLSWLGQSSAKFDRAAASAGDQVTLTIEATNDGASTIKQAAFTATLPLSVTYADGDSLTWTGSLAPSQTVTHSLALTIEADNSIAVPVMFDDLDHQLHFTATARLPINAPVVAIDLAVSPNPARPRNVITWTLTARNVGADAAVANLIAQVPFTQTAISGTLTVNIGTATLHSGTIGWTGALPAGQVVTVTYGMTTPLALQDRTSYGSAMITDGEDVWQAGEWLLSQPRRVYLPVIRK
jgi:uncharacterized repeat protein (TIGR01451 family)